MPLITLTQSDGQGGTRALLLNPDAIHHVEPVEGGGCKVATGTGETLEVTQSLDDLALICSAGTPVRTPGALAVAADLKVVRAANPADLPSGLRVRAHKATNWGEAHPAAHAAAVLRAESGDVGANEDVPKRDDAQLAADEETERVRAFNETRAPQPAPTVRAPLAAEYASVERADAQQEEKAALAKADESRRESRAARRKREKAEREAAEKPAESTYHRGEEYPPATTL